LIFSLLHYWLLILIDISLRHYYIIDRHCHYCQAIAIIDYYAIATY
jgi:hypothetical protein